MNLNFFISFEIVLIIMLTIITFNQDHKHFFRCSRDRSKLVRDVITKKLLPIYAHYQTTLPNICPFHPDRSLLWWPLQTIDSTSDWTCPFCGEDFYCAERLAHHWDEVHLVYYHKNHRDDLVCLADYCDIFRCDVLEQKQLQRTKQHLMSYLTFGQEEVSSRCDPEAMGHLQQSCLNVVHQCTVGLELNISAHHLRQVEKELSDSLCSYLTCDHYNEDPFGEENVSRKVPIILFSTIGVIMISGFCFCYYFIWAVFERGFIKTSDSVNKNIFHSIDEKHECNNMNQPSYILRSKENNKQTSKFLKNIFQFNHEDVYEFNDNFAPSQSEYESKLHHPISSIIEEDEDRDESEIDFSYKSYPIITRKFSKRDYPNYRYVIDETIPKRPASQPSSSSMSATVHKKSQNKRMSPVVRTPEIYVYDPPVKVHPKYIQPLKHSYSDRYPCYSGPVPETFVALSTRSRSYSHSQLRNAQHMSRILTRTKRQDSTEEEWDPKSQQTHSMISGLGGVGVEHTVVPAKHQHVLMGRPRLTSQSSLSYHAIPLRRRDELSAFSNPSSKTTSNASIASGCSRATNNSNQIYTKR